MSWINNFFDDVLGIDPSGGGVFDFFDDVLGIDPNGGGIFSAIDIFGIDLNAEDFYSALDDLIELGFNFIAVDVLGLPAQIEIDFLQSASENLEASIVFGNSILLSDQNSNDFISGSDANDNLNTGNGADTIYGWAGTDTLTGGGGADKLYGNNGADILYGDSGTAWNVAIAGNDILSGGNRPLA